MSRAYVDIQINSALSLSIESEKFHHWLAIIRKYQRTSSLKPFIFGYRKANHLTLRATVFFDGKVGKGEILKYLDGLKQELACHGIELVPVLINPNKV